MISYENRRIGFVVHAIKIQFYDTAQVRGSDLIRERVFRIKENFQR